LYRANNVKKSPKLILKNVAYLMFIRFSIAGN